MLVPGTSVPYPGKINDQSYLVFELINADVQNENPGLKKYFMHGTSHHMGLEFTITVS
jgi:hypothetical protein